MSPLSVSIKFSVPTSFDLTNALMYTIEGPTMIQSSTYVNRIISLPMIKQGSLFEGLKLLSTREVFNFLYQLQLPCFRPYKFLFNLRKSGNRNQFQFGLLPETQLAIAFKCLLLSRLAVMRVQNGLILIRSYLSL